MGWEMRSTGPWRRGRARKKSVNKVIVYAALLGVWARVGKLRSWPPYLFPPPWGGRTRLVGRLCRPQLLDWYCRYHEAHAHRLQLVGCARDEPWFSRVKQQVS